jgi:hypothetical protein
MVKRVPRYSGEEFSRRGQEIYARVVRPALSEADIGKFVVVDIESEDFEIGPDTRTALSRLLERRPDAQTWLERVGYVAAHSMAGSLPRREEL